jgi:hypothetical protein
MAGLGISQLASNYGSLAGRGPIPGGIPTNVSNASRGTLSQPQFGMDRTGANPLDSLYAQAEVSRALQGGQQAYERALTEQKRGWALEDQGTMMGLMGDFAGAGGGGTPARVTGDDSAWDASMASGMGRAKDAAAEAVGAARRALVGNMTARGIGGSGIEAKNERAIQLAGAGQIGAAGRTLAEQTAARRAAVSDRNYSGDVTQRGQDISAQSSRQSMLPSLLSLFRAAY